MTTIGLVRHGITDWNNQGKAQGAANIPLNEVGKQQANAIANRLFQEEKWDMIITSDLTRAIETAKIIGNRLNLPISYYDKRICEIHCGEIEGTTELERVEKWGNNWRELDLGMEKHEKVFQRAIEALEELIIKQNGKRILVVSHGALIGITLQRLLPERFESTYIDNTSITILKKSASEWDCLLYNCIKHLD